MENQKERIPNSEDQLPEQSCSTECHCSVWLYLEAPALHGEIVAGYVMDPKEYLWRRNSTLVSQRDVLDYTKSSEFQDPSV